MPVHSWFKLETILDDMDNPLHINFTGAGLIPFKGIALFIDDVFMVKVWVDSEGVVNEQELTITPDNLIKFIELGSFGQSLHNTESKLNETGIIGEHKAGSLKFDVRYV